MAGSGFADGAPDDGSSDQDDRRADDGAENERRASVRDGDRDEEGFAGEASRSGPRRRGTADSERPLRVLTVTPFWPSDGRPNDGVAIENRMRRLAETGAAQIRVLAPTPWFPFSHPAFGRYASLAALPRLEKRARIIVHRPRYAAPPVLSDALHARLLYLGVRNFVRALWAKRGPFDVIDAHRLYPDGVAAAWLARDLGAPLVLTAQGADLTQMERAEGPKARILEAVAASTATGAIGREVAEELVALGAPAERVTALSNGVDLELFRPPASPERRRALRLRLNAPEDAPLAVSAGPLEADKGFDLLIAAVASHPTAHLRIVGSGPESARLEAQIEALGANGRIRLLGEWPHRELPNLFGAADIALSACARGGWASMLLESLACGAPVVATPVWGAPEVIAAPDAGRISRDRSVEAIADALEDALAAPAAAAAVRAQAERFPWDRAVRDVEALLRSAAATAARPTLSA